MATVLLVGIAIASVSSAAIVLQGTLTDIQGNVEDWIGQEDREESTKISVDYGYNQSDYLLVDLRNTGSSSIEIVEDGGTSLNMYLEGVPEDWSFVSGSPYESQSTVILDPSATLTLNTTEKFPVEGESVEVEFAGPYETSTTYICFNENGACES
ncbi:hypothetical protein [Candidatus Nanohalobium constans]|uniref:hypothetical protein n=1 Tax=Candidatus Nanohalobium constans TaxID=2565781 RepID=UPI001C3D5773|nr:hypothetical protein [Candidatus Nanohalobium constans]